MSTEIGPYNPRLVVDLFPRIKRAIEASTVSRADAEWQWPTCHKRNCHQDHGDIDFVFRMFTERIVHSVYLELLCRATTDPEGLTGE